MANRYLCIHGHFYQPPRENAWLETVELQESAAPFHDWNHRINFECYAPNAASRILDEKRVIRDIVNNYRDISFNFGPTLLSWMELYDEGTYKAIIEADKQSVKERGGHGNAMAQAHSHLILPLANRRDKETQVIWGIRDFEYRFGRKPEGMWLAEAAVNTETLEVLAENGIKFTLLAPRQAKAVRKMGDSNWRELGGAPIDTRQPYLCRLPSGKTIALFFYDGPLSQAVAFEGVLNNGAAFAERLGTGFTPEKNSQLVHIATDGESYGHHHRYGDMALASCLYHIKNKNIAKLTNYGEYLALFPPTWEIQIHENSSWSCVHGVERWRSDCGCNSGKGWHQRWRKPLRDALDWLREELIPIYEREAALLLRDPWAARNAFVNVILNRKKANVEDFFAIHATHLLNEAERVKALRLLEMQRNAMYMYTSCGWFFDEVSGMETNQILQYACRAIAYASQVADAQLEAQFIKLLEQAPSNLPEYANGGDTYRRNVLPAQVNLERVAMHFAVASIFEEEPEKLPLFNYQAKNESFARYRAGSQVLSLGRTTVKSRITFSEKQFTFAALYLGQHNLIGSISTNMEESAFNAMQEGMRKAFESSNLPDMIMLMQKYFGPEKYSIGHLFKEEKRKVLEQILAENGRESSRYFREIYTDNYQLMTAFIDAEIPLPQAYQTAVAYVLNEDLVHFVDESDLSTKEFHRLIAEFKKWKVAPANLKDLEYRGGRRIFREMGRIRMGDGTIERLDKLNIVLELSAKFKFDFDRSKSQNIYFDIATKKTLTQFNDATWAARFKHLGELLGVRV